MPSITTTQKLSPSELAVLEYLPEQPEPISQREIARRTGLSVGLINAVIRKLITTGYVKTARLNQRSIEYLLTPSGLAEKTLKSYQYVLATVKNYRLIRCRLEILVDRLERDGVQQFYIHGDGELADLVAVFFEEAGRGNIRREIPSPVRSNAVLLNTDPLSTPKEEMRVVDLISELKGELQEIRPLVISKAGNEL